MERRLAESLIADDIVKHTAKLLEQRELPIIERLGGKETFSLIEDIAFLIGGVEMSQDKRWFESPELRAQLFRVLEAALPALLRAPRDEDAPTAMLRAIAFAKYLPERPKKPEPEMPKDARFMTDEELKQFFYLNEDNA